MGNPEIADRLDAFASLLELVEANPYTAFARTVFSLKAPTPLLSSTEVVVSKMADVSPPAEFA